MSKKMLCFSFSLALGLVLGATTGLLASEAKDFAADKGPKTVDVSHYPKDVQENYKVLASRCSKCHTLARAINTNMSSKSWKMYVKRMMNKPDSGISPDNGKKIYKFLKYYQAQKDKKKSK